MILYTIRHGETEWNKMGKMQGKTDISLSEDGRKFAQKTADGLKNIKFDYIFSSPLERAYETACIIKGDRDIEIVKDERLIEVGFGLYEGTVVDERKGSFARLMDAGKLLFGKITEKEKKGNWLRIKIQVFMHE